jgi:hypothetical protein
MAWTAVLVALLAVGVGAALAFARLLHRLPRVERVRRVRRRAACRGRAGPRARPPRLPAHGQTPPCA